MLVAEDHNRQAVFQQVATRSKGLATLLDSLEIPGDRRHTTGIELHELADPDFEPVSFRAEAGMWVRLEPEGPLTTLLARAVEEVGASVGGLGWYLSRGHPAHLEAVRRAALEARNRAEAAAGALGLWAASVLEIRLQGGPGPRRFAMAAVRHRDMGRHAEPDIEPGQISASAEVEVTFRLEPKAGPGAGYAATRIAAVPGMGPPLARSRRH